MSTLMEINPAHQVQNGRTNHSISIVKEANNCDEISTNDGSQSQLDG